MMKCTLTCAAVLAASVLLTGCNEKENVLYASPEVISVGTFDGCAVTFVERGWEKLSFYMAKCPGNSATTTRNYSTKNGKSTAFNRSTVIVQEIETLMAEKIEIEAREAALAKLSPTERTALGIK